MAMKDIRRNVMVQSMMNALEIQTATGNPVVFNTQMAKPLNNLVIPLTYIQEGSGDPSPSNIRPISGVSSLSAYRTGVNIFDEEFEEGMLSTTDGQNTPGPSNIRSKNYISVVPGEKYAVRYTAVASGTNLRLFYYKADKTYKGNNWCGSTGIYIADSDVHYIRFYMDTSYSASGDKKISINYPYTETEYVPYDGVKLDVTFPALGKNLLKGVESGAYTTSGIKSTNAKRLRCVEAIEVQAGQIYTISAINNAVGQSIKVNGNYYSEAGTERTGYFSWSDLPCTITIPTGAKLLTVTYKFNSEDDISATDISHAQIELGDTPSAYEPYNNSVYGGSLDLVSGVLMINMGMLTCNGSEDWTYSTQASFARPVLAGSYFPHGLKASSNVCANQLKQRISDVVNACWVSSTSNFLCYVDPTTIPDNTAWKSYLGEHNLQICYELEEPFTIQLDPHSITAIKGTNTVWTNTSENLTVTYKNKKSQGT